MKKKGITIYIMVLNVIAVASLALAWIFPNGKLGGIAMCVFVFIGYMPMFSYLSNYDNGEMENVEGIAIGSHFLCLFIMSLIIKYTYRQISEPFAYYLFGVLFVMFIALNRHNAMQYELCKNELEALYAKEEKQNENT